MVLVYVTFGISAIIVDIKDIALHFCTAASGWMLHDGLRV
jgi:hypothetical protein